MATQAQIDNVVSLLNQALLATKALTPDVTVTPPAPTPAPTPTPVPVPTSTGIQLTPKPIRLSTETLGQFLTRVAPYIANVIKVGQALQTLGAKACLVKAHSNVISINDNPIISLYNFNSIIAGNAPPHWDDKTMAAYNIDGSLYEKYVG